MGKRTVDDAVAAQLVDYATPVDLRRVGAHPDHWYPVAWSDDLKLGSAIGVRFGEEPIVLVRTKSGRLYALEDRCAHRQVPLHKGVVEGETLRCNYHGWTYDCAGACVDVPYIGMGRQRLPNGVRAYPVHETDGLLFVFPGDPALAEARKPAKLGAASDPRYKTRRLNRQVGAHYSFMHENLMDMNHQFLHRRQMGSIRAKCLDCRTGADWVEVDYTFSRDAGRQSAGEAVIVDLARAGRKKSAKDSGGEFTDLMTIATRYPYQDLRVWVGREGDLGDPVLQVWLGYVPTNADQTANRTFGYLSVLKPPVPGLIHLAWPFVTWFTEKIFTEDKDIVEQEQAAHDELGADRNNEIFPAIQQLRALLARCGAPG
jgi:phenylpropionate dioxygenase-like ring-hydroxylating dioxygenase large terminal subunit